VTLEVPTYRLTVSYLTRETCLFKKQDQAVTLYLLLSALLRALRNTQDSLHNGSLLKPIRRHQETRGS